MAELGRDPNRAYLASVNVENREYLEKFFSNGNGILWDFMGLDPPTVATPGSSEDPCCQGEKFW